MIQFAEIERAIEWGKDLQNACIYFKTHRIIIFHLTRLYHLRITLVLSYLDFYHP